MYTKDQRDAQQKAEVAHAIDQERLEIGEDGGGARVPEADQQVGHQANRFPAEEQLQEVVGHHQHQHREGEQRDVAEKALVARVIVHVADGVDVHHQGHEGHHQHHERGQRVDQEADIEERAARADPGVEVAVERVALEHVLEHQARSHEGDHHAQDRHPVRAARPISQPRKPAMIDPINGASGTMRYRDVTAAYSFRVSRSSTLMVFMLRNRHTRIARPIADSAAATVRMKNTKI